jgi:hypothetical protein
MYQLRARIDDAELLRQAGRLEGALLLVLVAVAARAKLELPDIQGERERFEEYVRCRFPIRLSVEYRGALEPVEHLFYKWMRCSLVHDGGLPPDLRIGDVAPPGGLTVRAGGAPEYVVLVSPRWHDELVSWALS